MIKISDILNISLETLIIEESIEEKNNDTDNLKQSIKYGIISFCAIFFVSIIIFSFKNDYSYILNKNINDKLSILFSISFRILSLSIPPSIIISFVFYFYILPKNNDRD